jgi:predicted MFS family arabinose efflux permease
MTDFTQATLTKAAPRPAPALRSSDGQHLQQSFGSATIFRMFKSTSILTPALTTLFSVACGFTVANIYYAQPLIGLIAPALGLKAEFAGLVMTLTQAGFGLGLLLVVPMADVFENRRLVASALGVATLGLLGIASANSAAMFLSASIVVGVCAAATHVLVPFASHLAPESSRGRVVGQVMAGLLAGIMLARPFSSLVAGLFGWRVVFVISGVVLLGLAGMLLRLLPERRPNAGMKYREILVSMIGLVQHTPVLRRRALYQGMMFAAFNVFWTGSPLLLMRAYGMSLHGVALFAFVGAGGALAAPSAGRLADRGLTKPATGIAMVAVCIAFILAAWAVELHSVLVLAIAGLLLDAAVQVCQVLSLRSIFMLAPELRSRLNGLYMAWVFGCGAVASGAAVAIYQLAGWNALACLGAAFAAAGLLYYLTEPSQPRTFVQADAETSLTGIKVPSDQ